MDINSLSKEVHIKDYLNVLRRRREAIVLFFVTTVLIVTIGSFLIKPVYRATATLLIDLESPNVLTSSGMVELQAQNYFSYKEYYQSQKEIVTSESILKKIFEEFRLKDSKDYAKAKEPLKKFMKTIWVEPVRDTRLLRLNVDNKDPLLAAKIANRIAEIYVTRNLYYISKNELMNLLKNEYLKLETKLSENSKVYKEGHPEMIRLKKEIAELVQKIEKEKVNPLTYDTEEEMADNTYRYTLQGLKANNISIQDRADVPIVPIRPKKLLNFAISIIIGLFGGIGIAFFLEYLDDTIKDADDVEKIVAWPFLGNIPKIDGDGKMAEFEKDIFVHIKPKDPTAEAYRSIRTSVLFSSTEDHPVKIIVMTSPGPQEGKTTTLCNLGIAMAQNGQRVLLVDADMRKPRLHEVFKNNSEKGLSDFLCGQGRFEEIVQKTDIENLFMVAGGTHPPNPSELLASHKTSEFISFAKAKYDFIMFDTPPVAMLTDAVILSKIVDATIMVIESGKTSKKVLSRISKTLSDAKVRIIGVILNRIHITHSHYYYYSRYYGKPN